jgi:hypothetical protein
MTIYFIFVYICRFIFNVFFPYVIIVIYYNGPSAWRLVKGLKAPHRDEELVTKCYTGLRAGPCEHGNESTGSIRAGGGGFVY